MQYTYIDAVLAILHVIYSMHVRFWINLTSFKAVTTEGHTLALDCMLFVLTVIVTKRKVERDAYTRECTRRYLTNLCSNHDTFLCIQIPNRMLIGLHNSLFNKYTRTTILFKSNLMSISHSMSYV